MKKLLQYFFSIAITIFFSINSYAQEIPDTLSTSYGEGADVFISNDDKNGPEENFNALSYLVIRNHDVRIRIIYLKFDIQNISRFEDGANQAYIGLYVNYAEKMADSTLEISVYGMTDDLHDDWEDELLSYSVAPGLEAADLNSYTLNGGSTEYLTKITVTKDYTGWVYSEPTEAMDNFINVVNQNNLLTFILIVEEPNTGDEVRFYAEEDLEVNRPPILHGDDPIINIESNALTSFNLKQNFPNPFIGNTTLTYNLKEPKHVELTMYNIHGTKVAILVDEFQNTGEYNVNVDMDRLKLSPGIYFAKINVDSNSQIIKMINCK